MNITREQIMSQLEQVLDPELNISIVDLGLVYEVDIKEEGGIKIVMTLTTIGCPLFNLIETDVKNKLGELGIDQNKIEMELTFEPPWSMEKMSERAKAMLGI